MKDSIGGVLDEVFMSLQNQVMIFPLISVRLRSSKHALKHGIKHLHSPFFISSTCAMSLETVVVFRLQNDMPRKEKITAK